MSGHMATVSPPGASSGAARRAERRPPAGPRAGVCGLCVQRSRGPAGTRRPVPKAPPGGPGPVLPLPWAAAVAATEITPQSSASLASGGRSPGQDVQRPSAHAFPTGLHLQVPGAHAPPGLGVPWQWRAAPRAAGPCGQGPGRPAPSGPGLPAAQHWSLPPGLCPPRGCEWRGARGRERGDVREPVARTERRQRLPGQHGRTQAGSCSACDPGALPARGLGLQLCDSGPPFSPQIPEAQGAPLTPLSPRRLGPSPPGPCHHACCLPHAATRGFSYH